MIQPLSEDSESPSQPLVYSQTTRPLNRVSFSIVSICSEQFAFQNFPLLPAGIVRDSCVQTACSEPFMHHATLAIGALLGSHYHPTQPRLQERPSSFLVRFSKSVKCTFKYCNKLEPKQTKICFSTVSSSPT